MTIMSEHRTAASRHLGTLFAAGTLGSLADGELLRRFLAGRGDDDSAAAFAAVAERHGPMVLGVCRRALGDLHDAEDAAQATFLVLARRAGSIRRAGSLASWLFGVAIKVAAKRRAQAARRKAIEQQGAEMRARTAGSDLSPEDCAELYEQLDRLPERFRAPIVLCHLEGLSNEQAAGRLGVPVRTVQRRLSEGRERLRHRLTRLGLAPAAGLPALGPVADGVSASWIEATARAAAGLAAGRAVGAVASAPVAAMVEGATTAMIAARAKAVAVGLVLVAGLAVLGGAGAWLAAGWQDRPPAKARGARPVFSSLGRESRWIRGIVVDETGKPVGGARVAPLWAVRPQSVVSRPDGTFVIPFDEPRRMNQAVIATADAGARQGIFRYDGPTGYKGARTLARVVLRPARVVTVSVVDGGGTPVPDADAFVLDMVFPVAEAKTDARGIAALRVPADAWTQWIVAAKPGVGFDYFENYRNTRTPPWNPPPSDARLVLEGARTVRVRAVDSADRPVPGVELYPLTVQKKGKLRPVNLSPFALDRRTDASGVATFDWLPADLMAGTAFYSASLSYDVPDPPIPDVDKPGAELVARVLRPTRLSGKVTRPDGSPAAGIRVEAQGIGGSWRGSGFGRARTADDGSYELHVSPEQSYTIAVVDDEWAAKGLIGVIVREGVPQAGLDLTLERGAVIHGRATAGRGSEPLAGRPIMLIAERGPAVPPKTFKDQSNNPVYPTFTRIADTEVDGTYAFRVEPGEYQLVGPRPPGEPAGKDRLKVAEGQELERDFHLARDDRQWKTLRGVVRARDAGGPPVAGAILVFQDLVDRSPPVNGSADDQGRFELAWLGGKAIAFARSPAGDLAVCAAIDPGDEEVTLVAGPATTARGRVVDQDGKPWASINAGAHVEAGLPAVGRDRRPGAGEMVLTDDDGRFTATGLPVGAMCDFWASAPGGGSVRSRPIEIQDARPFEAPPLVIPRKR